MTKKHFIIVASALAASKPEDHWDPNKKAQWIVSCDRIADRFEEEFPRFKRDVFLAACAGFPS